MALLMEKKDVVRLLDEDPLKVMELPYEEYRPLQLYSLKNSFNILKDKILILHKAAKDKNITDVNTEKDIIPTLFSHKTYKTYPEQFLEQKRFDKMNQWLSTLSIYDFTKLDTTGVTTIDEWLDRLDKYGFFVTHSSGTSGKPSFLPKAPDDLKYFNKALIHLAIAGMGMDISEPISSFLLLYPVGRTAMQRGLQNLAKQVSPENRIFYAFKGEMSADRLRQMALTKKSIAEGKLSAEQRVILEENEKKANRVMDQWMHEFLDNIEQHHLNERVFFFGAEPLLARLALTYVPQGYTNLFSPDSYVCYGGGLKGARLPPNYINTIENLLGIPKERFYDGYGMTEKNSLPLVCKHGYKHIPPWELPILLDPKTQEWLNPEGTTGKVTGQYAFFDPIATSYWGGIITGDLLTIDFDGCPANCGWTGPVVLKIDRLTDIDGPDADKISCSATFQDYIDAEIR